MEQIKDEHEIRIKVNNPTKQYINRAATLLLRDQLPVKEGEKKQEPLKYVLFQASGKAINTALVASDVIRRKIPGLHQINRIKTVTIERRQGADKNNSDLSQQALSVFEVLLTRQPSQQEKKEPGYLGELPKSEQDEQPSTLEDIVSRPKRGSNRYIPNRKQGRPDHQEGGNYRRENKRQYRKGSNDSRPGDRRGNYRENYRSTRRNNDQGGRSQNY